MTVHARIPDRVAMLMPACSDPREKELRDRLLRVRDYASHTLGNWRFTCTDALDLNRIILQVSAQYAFDPGPLDRLESAAEACRHLLEAANLIDILEAADVEG